MNARQKQILSIVMKQGTVSNTVLSTLCGVTPETIRKDLNDLESLKLLERIHGGARISGDYYCTDFDMRLHENYENKQRIAAYAASFIKNDDILFIDAGTTTYLIHNYIPGNISFHLITNSQYNINEYSHNTNVKVISVGGLFDPNTNAYSGDISQLALSQYNILSCFLSVAAISPRLGIMDTNSEHSRLIQIAKDKAKNCYILADSSKFNKIALINLCPLCSGDTVITDTGLNEDTRKELEAMGVNVYMV